MKRRRLLSLLLTALFLWTAPMHSLASEAPSEAAIRQQASRMLDLLAQADYPAAHALFAPSVSQLLSVEQLQAVWEEQVLGICGEYQGVQSDKIVEQDGYHIYQALAEFSKWTAQIVIPFDASLAVYGVQCVPYKQVTADESTIPEGIVEEPVIVGQDTAFPLEGLLTLPAAPDGPLPAVVLVHGTGSNDKDETAYAYKPFRDIAWALAQRGYAVLRYDKRTLTYAKTLYGEMGGVFTIREETIDDALEALALLAADERIDSDHIYVLGHSLGGMMAPRIINESGSGFAGGILMSGSPRTLIELIVDQSRYALETGGYDEAVQNALKQNMDQTLADYAKLAGLDDEAAKAMTLSGFNGYFLKEMDAHPVAGELAKLDCPLFILQGDKDMQVYADKDFAMYQTLAEGRDNITLKLYPGLNHFMHPSTTDPASAEEYYTETEMDAQFLGDIGDWLDAQTR